MVRLGQHPEPRHRIAHISDTHFLDGARPLYGELSSETTLQRALDQLEISGLDLDAIVFTGDLADLGETDAYQRLRSIVDPVAERLAAQTVWVMGNHDEREPFAEHMLGTAPTAAPQDAVYDIRGLRIVALDSTVPGYHHGALDAAQLDWLRDVLAEPAPHGTLLALHHPPIPSPVEIMAILELQDQPALAEVVRGSDVIGILGGHLHYSTHSTFAGVPVSVAAATCYTMDVLAPIGRLAGVDGGQSIHLTEIYDDRIVDSIVPIGSPRQVSGFDERVLAALAELSPDERREAFSDKLSQWRPPGL